MNRWIAGLMEVAKEKPSPIQPADVVPTLQRVVEAVAPELVAKELKLELETSATELVCAHDPATLEHALIAMVVNAIEASPLGAAIRLRAELYPDVNNSGNESIFSAQVCRISVIDQGSGLPPDEPERVFDYSYSTKQRGMGLGLALARQALRRQRGSAHAFNNPNGGATVYVEVPLAN
jgi:signal transduction histidine kinase